MKTLTGIFFTFLLIASICFTLPVSAASASATLTGPGAVRAGDTITLTFKLNGSGLSGASGTLSYDSSQLTLSSTKQIIASPWLVEFSGNNMVAYDNNLTSPINGNKDLFSVTFKVKDVAVGTRITVSCTGVKASDGSADANVGTVSYSTTVAAPLSTNTSLETLTVSNAAISPTFSAGTTSYTASVPFSVSKLDVSATVADGAAKVSVNSPTLTPDGTTNVTVTVTAENGSKKTYTIKVTREKDPNYVASGNNALSSITIDGFLLSPGFDGDVTQYIVWLPYETESVKVNVTAADSKANIEISGGKNLAAGQDNTVTVTCIAENGDRKEYTIIVKRAAAHDGSVDEKPTETEQPTSEPTTPEPETTPTDNKTPVDGEASSDGFPLWGAIIMLIAGLALGFGGGFIVKGKMKG